MKEQRRKSIFYFEDDIDVDPELLEALRENYEVTLGAHWELIKKERQSPFDLVIIDLMIHQYCIDEEEKEVKNVFFEGIDWKRTGIEFLRRIRQDEYEKFGFLKDVPVIIASAVSDYNAKKETRKWNINEYFEKPFTIEEIEKAVMDLFKN